MKSSIPFSTNKLAWVAVGLMALQLVFKAALELGVALSTGNGLIGAVAIFFTAGWTVAIPLSLSGRRLGYWLGAIFGLMHLIMTTALPVNGLCDHYTIAAIVSLHGLLIAATCLVVLARSTLQANPAAFRFASRNQMWAYIVLCASTVVRVLWITFREPTGAARAEAAVAGRGGLAELAGLSLSTIVVIAMLSLCVMIPGIVLRKRWGYTAAAWFGALMVVLTAANVVLMVNQGSGPAVVIPSSLGMFCGAMWLRSLPEGPQPERQKLADERL